MRQISDLLRIPKGITALLGGGGKTTLMYTLARELRERGTVLVCTSTKILRPSDLPVLEDPSPAELTAALKAGPVCLGTAWPGGKLAAPKLPFPLLAGLADYVLVEADGAKCLPAKAHAEWEPVIPEGTRQTVLVVGADCFGRPVGEICHRPELFCAVSGAAPADPVTPELLARVIRSEGYGNIIYVNKTETDAQLASARALQVLLAVPVIAGSLRSEYYVNLEEDVSCSS